MSTHPPTGAGWNAGVAKVLITPQDPIRLAGFDHRVKPSAVVRQDIYARALALQDETGAISVIIASDLLGFSRDMADEIAGKVESQHGIRRDRLVINASHNHSAPVTGDLLHLYFELEEEEKPVIARYTAWVIDRLVEAAGLALQKLEPVELAFGQSLAGFGVNRRRSRTGCRHLPGPVDHDVPVLTATSAAGELLAIVFGYACHTTASFDFDIHGDYAGFAQTELEERYPGTTAMFVTGCAGDINPLPRFRHETPEIYGNILATAVIDVLRETRPLVSGPLLTAYDEPQLPLGPPVAEAELAAQLTGLKGTRRREIEYALGFWQRGEERIKSCPFPIQVWAFGDDLLWIWLSGEPVVDYGLGFKESYGWNNTWVSGYCNELLAYIPTERVLHEGGYEGTDGMLEYGLPGPFAPEVEEVIVNSVDRMVNDLRRIAEEREAEAEQVLIAAESRVLEPAL